MLLSLTPKTWQGYDHYHGFIIRAKSEAEARQLAAETAEANREGDGALWLDPEQVTCERIGAIGAAEIISSTYRHG